MTPTGLEHDEEIVRSFDGTELAARRMGEGETTPLLVVNAVGAGLALWRRTLQDVARHRQIVMWDHRGLLGSGPPLSDRTDPGAQAEDGLAVLEHFGIERFVMASWSNGTRIALEIAHRRPDDLAALSIVCGGYGHPLGRLLRNFELASALPTVAGVAKHFAGLIEGPFRRVTSRPEIAGLVRQSGMIAATADTSALVDLLRGMASCDTRTLLATYEAIAGDPAPELLTDVQVPTLIVAGERDPFTPLRVSQEMAASIPAARLEVYERATHYLPIEYPAKLAADLQRFWADLGL
ncbi:MAG: alpha/beta hydrolase [Actinomycetota bacterium]|nr:alpha/beta hydrolase [Actinomycetota bacterium]